MWLTPTWSANSLSEWPPSTLQSMGIQGALMDLDNTLMIPRTPIVPEHIQAWLAEAKQVGFGIVVVSNNKQPVYLAQAREILGLPVIGFAQKPRRRYLKEGIERLSLSPEKVVVIGDRPLTDIWGGCRLGAKTLWVRNLTADKDKPGIQLLRAMESCVVHPQKKLPAASA